MGDPRRLSSKFSGPGHPWQKLRIDEEKKFLKEYGLKNKEEIWKLSSKLKNFTAQAKKLIAATGPQANLEKSQLIQKLNSLGLIEADAKLDNVLGLTIKDLLERRLQTVILRKKLAKTAKQARQFISHEHVLVGKKKITSPSYLVKKQEEALISFVANSTLANSEHPERKIEEKPEKLVEKEKNETKNRPKTKPKAKV